MTQLFIKKYEICPLCNGAGGKLSAAGNFYELCTKCGGEQYIPVYIPEKKK